MSIISLKSILCSFIILCAAAAPGWSQQSTPVSRPISKDGWSLDRAVQTVTCQGNKTKVSFNLTITNRTGRNVKGPNFGAHVTFTDNTDMEVGTGVFFPGQDDMALFKNGATGTTSCGMTLPGRKTVRKVRFYLQVGDFMSPKVYFN